MTIQRSIAIPYTSYALSSAITAAAELLINNYVGC